jgi:putative transposase
VKYAFINQHRQEFSIKAMCRVFEVSRSGFYDWMKRDTSVSPRQQRQTTLDHEVAKAFTARKGRSGSPEITLDLKELGIHYNRKTIAKSMRNQGLRAKAAKKFKATTNSNHSLPVAENLLDRNFTAEAPNQKWVSDITYLWTDEGWLYLAVIIDLYSRMVVGWSMSERMTTSLISDALIMAVGRRQMPRNVIVHSDRGSQYCSHEYQNMLKKFGLICSMSRKGNCWDNACAESFFHTMKVELIHDEKFSRREELKHVVFEYIEVDYNRNRRHSAIGLISPAAFEAKRVA